MEGAGEGPGVDHVPPPSFVISFLDLQHWAIHMEGEIQSWKCSTHDVSEIVILSLIVHSLTTPLGTLVVGAV